MLYGRLRELLRLLLAAETPITSSVIAANVKVTTRTVRNDIKELQTVVEKKRRFHSICQRERL